MYLLGIDVFLFQYFFKCRTLEPCDILKACRYKEPKTTKTSKENQAECNQVDDMEHDNCLVEPQWRSEFNCDRKYIPSYNIAPTDITPVLVSKYHFYDEEEAESMKGSRVVVPMMWGMIPFWHKGDYRRHGLTTNNCRLEHMLNSKLFRGPFRRGQRCAVVCEGRWIMVFVLFLFFF